MLTCMRAKPATAKAWRLAVMHNTDAAAPTGCTNIYLTTCSQTCQMHPATQTHDNSTSTRTSSNIVRQPECSNVKDHVLCCAIALLPQYINLYSCSCTNAFERQIAQVIVGDGKVSHPPGALITLATSLISPAPRVKHS